MYGASGKPKPAAAKSNKAEPAVQAATANVSATADASAETRNEMREPPRREPSVFTAREEAPKAEAPQPATPEASMSAMEDEAPQSQQTGTAPASFSATDEAPSEQPNTAELNASHTPEPHAELESNQAPEEPAAAEPDITPEPEPVLRAEPEDAVFAKHASDAPKRRQLRADTVGDRELDDDEIDEYRLVDFEGIGRSFKRRIIERRKEKAIKKAEKAKRAEALAKQKAERKALAAEQRREARQAAEAEKARIAQEKAQAREAAAANEAAAQRDAVQQAHAESELERYANSASRYEDHYQSVDDEYDDAYAAQGVVRAHPTLEKALRHDVNGEHAKETLANADELVVISVLSRDPEGFDGDKLLELMMACGLRYCRAMGVFNRFETESPNSELQFSMVNVLKPGTFPIEEMDEFVTPGITFLMPLPGAVDSSAAFEAMVETAMVVVRHMGGELKDENRSVMTAQTIEFARQRVHEFERRHRLHRHMQAR